VADPRVSDNEIGSPSDAGELEIRAIELTFPIEVRSPPGVSRPLAVQVREARLLDAAPWVRSLGKLGMEVSTEGWRFPVPATEPVRTDRREDRRHKKPAAINFQTKRTTRLKPSDDTVLFKDRLLYLLQPPLENLFTGRAVHLPFQPFPYQLDGIAFLMPRDAALLADEMGLGKTIQTILALRLLFHANLIHRALVVCPKPLVTNWARELRLWAEDVPFEVIAGNSPARRAAWVVSNCPLKLVNYEVLTRDAGIVGDDAHLFDVVVLDEAQRIKNPASKTAEVVKSLHRRRSWALTGTPIENKPDDLVNIFAFVDPGRIPPDTPARRLPQLTADCILRRVKEDVLEDMPPRILRDACLELSPAQKDAYELAEKEGVVRLNRMGDTITVQHVFELVMRLKQICNFDPLTGHSSKLEQLQADLAEVAESGRKAIVFSQWVEPLERLAVALTSFGPVQYHGKVPQRDRHVLLDRFKNDPRKHVLLMSYGTGSVGLNLQFANYVFLFDRWWNPAVEDQAINRAHRIGQKSPVIVTRFVSQGTIEERIAEVLERKRQVFNELIEQNGPPPSLGLNQEDVFSLFDLRVRPRKLLAA
jgi:SNF2 family DNA or RNA helicase